jgi:hypothetical protein
MGKRGMRGKGKLLREAVGGPHCSPPLSDGKPTTAADAVSSARLEPSVPGCHMNFKDNASGERDSLAVVITSYIMELFQAHRGLWGGLTSSGVK